MFSETKVDSSPPFIQSINMGWVKPFPSMFYCQVKFSVDQYDDELFTQFSIPFPNQLILAVVKRKAEYLAARYAAKRALRLFGCNETPGTSPDRSPLWPSEWCGSLSHSDECSIAVIAPKKSGMTPGIDIEFFAPEIMRETADIFVSADEKYVISDSGIDYTTALLIIFSVKESLFKALYPEVGRFFNFDAAKVCRIETSDKKITLELTQNLSRNRISGSRIEGYYSISDGKVITVVA